LPRRDGGAISLAVAVRPDQLARFSVECNHRSTRAGRRVEHAVDGERRPFELVLGTRAEVVGLETPRHFEVLEVARVDLIERRVLRPANIRGVVRPVAVLRARHRTRLTRGRRGPERQSSRNSFAGVPMSTNMKFAWPSVGFMPRSLNHLVTKSRTCLLRFRSFVVKLASC